MNRSRRCSWVGLAFCLAVLCVAPGVLRAQETLGLDDAFQKAASYEFGQSRECLTAIEDAVRKSLGTPAERDALAKRLAGLLGSNATLSCKQFVCRQLVLIGSDETVPALAALLPKADTSDMARYALERIPGAAADNALLEALPQTLGRVQIGIINSIGERRTAAAAASVAPMLKAADVAAARAAIAALGKIGGPEAAAALKAARPGAPADLHKAFGDAYLMCADQALAAGKKDDAAAMFLEMYAPTEPGPVRVAALEGLARTRGEAAIPVVIEALVGKDAGMAAIAAGLIRQMPGGAKTTETFAAQLANVPPAVQVMLLYGLADRGDVAGLPAATAALGSADAAVRIAAIEAVGKLGGGAQAALLAERAAQSEGAEQKAARSSLDLLRGADVDPVIEAQLSSADPKVVAELVRSLGARTSAASVPALLKTAQHADESVRLESLKALAEVATEKDLPALVNALLAAKQDNERDEAQRTVVAVAHKAAAENKPSAAMLAALASAKEPKAQCVLLTTLSLIGENASLEAVRAAVKSDNAEVQDAAIRALAGWPSLAALSDGMALARNAKSETHQILALRGALRMLALPSDRSGDESLKYYTEALSLAKGVDEKRAVLAGLADLHAAAALDVIIPFLTDPELQAEAGQAAAKVKKSLYKSEASQKSANAGMALDNDPNTRWDTGADQKGGEWFLVDLGSENAITKVVLDSAKSASDYPRGYEAYVSNDKANWGAPVAKGEGTKPVFEIPLEPKAGRYLKIVQTGKADRNFWSIHEVTIETK